MLFLSFETLAFTLPERVDEYQKMLLSALDKYIKAVKHIYQGKATSFASVLNDALALQNLLEHYFLNPSQATEANTPTTETLSQTVSNHQLNNNSKYVYVRIFHRLMPTLATPNANFSWIKSLLDSVTHAEKHGFGVYAEEEDVVKSLKDDQYGYITLQINEEQDITAQRPEKICPIVGCPLLTITNINLDNILRLTHNQVNYNIKDGILHRNN